MPITDIELLDYLSIDYADDVVRSNIARCIRSADAFIKGSVGPDYPVEDPRAKELALIVAGDFYDNRAYQATTGGSVSANTRKLVDDLSWQLRLELGRAQG